MSNRFNLVRSNTLRSPQDVRVLEKVACVFKQAIGQLDGSDNWHVETDVRLKYKKGSVCPVDIVVLKDGQPFLIALIKRSGFVIPFKYSIEIERLRVYRRYYGAAVVMFCDEDYILNVEINGSTPKKYRGQPSLTAENITDILSNYKITTADESFCPQKVRDAWNVILSKNEYSGITVIEGLKSFVRNLADDDFSLDGNIFSLSREKEEEFFETLLGTPNGDTDTIIRFTSFTSLFRTCNRGSQSMCSIVCMNDKSEVDYGSEKTWKLQDLPFPFDINNNCFILSGCSCEMKESLTMMRLYADNNKGVVIEYAIDKDILKRRGFHLACVSYAGSDGKDPKLKLIKELIITTVQRYAFALESLEVWGHFFKPYDYKDEKEIRLLFYENETGNTSEEITPHGKEWIYDNSLGIIAPIVTFDITESNNQLPLIIKSITLCSNVREVKTNQHQLICLINDKKIKTCGDKWKLIQVSKVGNYRPGDKTYET